MLTLKRYFILTLFIIIFTLFSSSLAFAEGIVEKPKIRADGAILIDAQSGMVLFNYNGYRSMHPASLTKIMTALLAIEKGNLNNQVVIGEGPPKIYIGSTIKLRKGEIISLGDLVKAALIVSANDSTVAIGEHIGGNQELFIQWMNQKAYTIGAYNTRFVNTNGYSKPNHRTTPYDLALISRYAMANKNFEKLVNSKEDIIYRISFTRGKKMLKEYPIRNTNKLLWHSKEIVGIKTGTTARAGGCLIAAAKKNEHMLIAVSMHTSKRYQDSLSLLDYGFNNYKWHEKLKKKQIISSCKVKKGDIDQVKILADKAIFSITSINEKDNTRLKYIVPKVLKAPFSKGKVVGEAILYKNNVVLDKVNLVTDKGAIKD